MRAGAQRSVHFPPSDVQAQEHLAQAPTKIGRRSYLDRKCARKHAPAPAPATAPEPAECQFDLLGALESAIRCFDQIAPDIDPASDGIVSDCLHEVNEELRSILERRRRQWLGLKPEAVRS
jgi:hypothetical protein